MRAEFSERTEKDVAILMSPAEAKGLFLAVRMAMELADRATELAFHGDSVVARDKAMAERSQLIQLNRMGRSLNWLLYHREADANFGYVKAEESDAIAEPGGDARVPFRETNDGR